MIFWVCLALALIFIGVILILDNSILVGDLLCTISCAIDVVLWIVVGIMVITIVFEHVGVDAKINRFNARHDIILYQLETNAYDNDNDIGKRDLFEQIREWNEDLAYNKVAQNDPWIGIFYANIYDKFEPIELPVVDTN